MEEQIMETTIFYFLLEIAKNSFEKTESWKAVFAGSFALTKINTVEIKKQMYL